MCRRIVGAGTAGVHLHIAGGCTAEIDDPFAVLGDLLGCGNFHARLERVHAQDMRNQYFGRGVGIGIPGVGIAAEATQEPMNLALSVVEAPGTGPAINGIIALGVAASCQRLRGDIECFIPVHGNERLLAPSRGVTFTPVFVVPLANHGAGDSTALILGGGKRSADWRRFTVLGYRRDGNAAVRLLPSEKVAPMGGGKK